MEQVTIGNGRERRYKDMLILKYERKDFFNNRIYTEDKKNNYTKEDLKKVFAYFSKTNDASRPSSVASHMESFRKYIHTHIYIYMCVCVCICVCV